MNDKLEKFSELEAAATRVEQAVTAENIYEDKTFEQLVVFENEVNRIAFETGTAVSEILGTINIKSPFQLLVEAIDFWDKKLGLDTLPSDDELVENLRTKFRVRIEQVDEVFVPTDESEPLDKLESGEEREPVDFNRVALALHTILNTEIKGMPIRLNNVKISVGSAPSDINSSRKRPYWVIEIENFRIAVFVDNQAWNRTFVMNYKSNDDLKNLRRKKKSELKDEVPKDHIAYNFIFKNSDQFVKDLRACLERIAEGKGIKKMDKEYFGDKENVRRDLEAYKVAAKVESLEKLKPYHLTEAKDTECANGEVVIGSTYLARAGVAMGLVQSSNESMSNKLLILNALKKHIGVSYNEIITYSEMDLEYFCNLENVKKDLEGFAKAADVKDLKSLSTHSIHLTYNTCVNGENITGSTYLRRAAVAFKLATTIKKAGAEGITPLVLRNLKRLIGVEVDEVYPEMDVAYFTKENVAKDLEAYRIAIGLASVNEITTNNIDAISAKCANGEYVRGGLYIARAGQALKLGDTNKTARKHGSKILNRIKQICGLETGETEVYPEMNKEYFSEPNIRADLEAYRIAIGLETISQINTANLQNAPRVLCQNGELTTGQTYIYRAGKAFTGLSGRKAKAQMGKILNTLKKIIGLEVEEIKEYPPMDTAYFNNSENVSFDLAEYAKSIDISVDDLNVNKMHLNKVVCKNGEEVEGGVYLRRAGVALGFIRTTKERYHPSEVLNRLRNIASSNTKQA